MKCAFKYGLFGLMVIATALCEAGELNGRNGPANGIFYQPWQADLSLTRLDWKRRMVRLHDNGLDTLYLQWLQYDEFNFLNAHIKKDGLFIQVILDTAAHQGIGVYIGLFSDPEYFHSLNLPTAELGKYLFKLREKTLRIAVAFQARYGKHPAFQGWYLPEEIDDLNWQPAPRRKLLNTHIHLLSQALKSLGEKKPVAFSAFFSGALSPEAFTLFCQQLLEGTDAFVLVQDGLGGRMDIPTTRKYHESLLRTPGKQDRLGWIMELYNDELPGPAFRGKAIAPNEFNERFAVVHKSFMGKRLALFSLRYWLAGNARLSKHYRQHFFNTDGKKTVKAPR
jgi:hypothetical protein